MNLVSDVPRDHLIIPDRQANPRSTHVVDISIGNYILKHKPAVIVNIGDHADMESLSTYDIGKKSFEGRRYTKDVEASTKAHEAMWRPVAEYNAQRRKNKEKVYNPLKVITIGNHENRINRAIENDPKLDGLISMDDLEYDRWYDHVLPFLAPVIVDGICYVHYAFKKMPHQAISGKHQARTILDEYKMSVTVGHTPEFHYAESYRGDDKRIQCIVAGACFDHNEEYAGARNNRYWRGIVHKRNVKEGNYDFETISLERLLKEYS
jgi:hypothetical protein